MKKIISTLLILFILTSGVSQNGKILSSENFNWKNYPKLVKKISDNGKLKTKYNYLNSVKIEKITYLSDGLKVVGYLAQPLTLSMQAQQIKYPCIIYNRGGNKEFGKLNEYKVVFILAKIASWNYVVAASQYRGNDGGKGKEEFGGKDVNDVLNLIPLLNNVKSANVEKMGIYGWSRGGMMTYLALTKTNKFKAAVVGGGLSDLVKWTSTRNDTIESIYFNSIPNYTAKDTIMLKNRSAIYQVKNISKTTPILMVHGTSDWRVTPEMAIDLSKMFLKNYIPHRLVLFEGGSHGLREFTKEVNEMSKKWFDDYLKNEKSLPNLKPHTVRLP